MNKSTNFICRLLMVLLLCAGVVVTSCEGEGPLGEENTEQGSGDDNVGGGNDVGGNNESGENGGGEGDNGESDGNAGTSGAMTWSLDKVTEMSATFSGTLAVAASDLSFSQITVYYSDAATFNINDAQKASTTTFDSDQKFVITVTGLKINMKYNYCLVAEVKSEKTYGEVKNFTTASLVAPTLNAALGVTEVSSTISGTVSVALGTAGDLEYGFQYCASEDFSSDVISKKITDIDSENKFSLQITGLVPMTTYYYRSYVKMNGVYGYGEVKSFVTVSLVTPALNAASDITEVSSTISGTISVALGTAGDLEYGFQYCASEDFSSDVITKKITDIGSENKFSLQITGLVPMTTYYYRSYVKMNGVYGYGEVKSFVTVSLVAPTLDAASDITEVSSTISGTVSVALGTAGDLEYGFQYCASEDFSSDVISKKITDIDSENKFSLQITGLVPMTTYYYRSYVKMNGVYGYGEVKSFVTVSLVAPTLNAASDITYDSATISGNVNRPSEIGTGLEYGFQYSQLQDFASNVTNKKVSEVDSENNFSVEMFSLTHSTTYYYRSYIKMDGVTMYGELQSFKTLSHPYDQTFNLNIASAKDLSSSGSANCYIVSNAGLYKFKAVKGNSNESVGNVVSAAMLWETFGTSTAPEVFDLISAFCYKDGYIVFQIADTFKAGNAVVAAKDASDNILWSWHIWFTDQPQEQVYYNNAGTMMDRNLGATSATPGDVGALGLLYQWGRKDPFLGSSSISISSSSVAKSTITWPSAVQSDLSTGTIDYANANPTTFIKASNSPYDWHYSSRDNTLWTTSETSKSIYDPCPAGWRVPDGVWSTANGSSSSFDYTYNSGNNGMNFSGKFGGASTIWYPASGYRSRYDGSLCSVGDWGNYWSASPGNSFAFRQYYGYYGDVYPSCNENRAFGFSVRCVRESK